MSETKADTNRALELAREMHNSLAYTKDEPQVRALPLTLDRDRFKEIADQLEALAKELEWFNVQDVTMKAREKGHHFIPSLVAEEECALCGEFFGCCTNQSYEEAGG